MSDKNLSGVKKKCNDDPASAIRGYQPTGGQVTGGYKPKTSELKPVNPPKKK